MKRGSFMICREIVKNSYEFNGHIIQICKNIADKYSDIICPITEESLTLLLELYGQNCNDVVLSHKIESDMEQELKEYGYTI